jgi:signal peptidase II
LSQRADMPGRGRHAAVPSGAGSGLPGEPGRAADTKPRRIRVLVGVAALVLIADIISKALVVANLSDRPTVHVIGNFFMLTEVRNSGAAFGIGTGDTIVFTAIAVGVIIYIVRTARNLRSLGWAITLGLLLGGAAGNLGDRIFRAPGLFRGDVVDWIEVTRWWPVFNLADSAIVCGGILTVLLALRRVRLDGTRDVSETTRRPGAHAQRPASSSDPASVSRPAPPSHKSDVSGHIDVAADLDT